jgi:hypothetical protein
VKVNLCFSIFLFCIIGRSHAFDLNVNLYSKTTRTEFKSVGEIYGILFKPKTGLALKLGFEFGKTIRMELGYDSINYEITNSSFAFETTEFKVTNNKLSILVRTDSGLFTRIGYAKNSYVLTSYLIDPATSSITPEVNAYSLTQYELGIGLITRGSSVMVITELTKTHIPDQSVGGFEFTGRGTDIGIKIEMNGGIGIHFNYTNSTVNYTGESIVDEKKYGIYQRIQF